MELCQMINFNSNSRWIGKWGCANKLSEVRWYRRKDTALKKYLNFKLEICLFWINTDISLKIITDTFIQLKISFFNEDTAISNRVSEQMMCLTFP